MDLPLPKRPTGITVTAWLWIVTGGFTVFGGLLGGFAYSMMGQMGQPPAFPSDMPGGFVLMTAAFQYFGVLLVLQTVVAILAVWAGIALLQLKAWARTAVEALSWLSLVCCVGFGIFWIYLWVSMTGRMPKTAAPVDIGMFQMLGAAMGAVVTVAFAVPLWIMIRYLRGTEVRTAIANARRPGA